MATRRQIRRAIELHEQRLASRPEVVGIGADWDTSKTKKGEDRDHAVAVYVASYADLGKGDEEIPKAVEIPARSGVHVIPVVVKEIGELRPEEKERMTPAPAQSDVGDETAASAGMPLTEMAFDEHNGSYDDDEGLFYAE